MNAEAYLQSGDLDRALAELKQEIRQNPENVGLRVFLFQLYSVLGQWDQALTQLNVAAEMDADVLLLAQVYRPALNCEVFRSTVFQGHRTPMFFGEPLEWMVWLTQIPGLLAGGRSKVAADLRDKVFEAAPAVSGQVDEQEFAWIADADERLGPILEAIINGRYYWVPFERIRKMEIEKPTHLRDVIWARARLTWANEGQALGLIPSRYPGSEQEADHAIRMSRKTDWLDAGCQYFVGLGQRMLATDQSEYSLLDIREVTFDQLDGPPEGSSQHG